MTENSTSDDGSSGAAGSKQNDTRANSEDRKYYNNTKKNRNKNKRNNKYSNAVVLHTTKFKGKTVGLEDHVFETYAEQQDSDRTQFQETIAVLQTFIANKFQKLGGAYIG